MRQVPAALNEVRRTRFLIDRVDKWIYDEISPHLGQRILEVGCGLGNLLQHLSGRSLVVGIEKDAETVSCLRAFYRDVGNVQIHKLDICDPAARELAKLRLDTVVSLNVFEHIENDILAFRNVAEILDPGGSLVLVVPAHRWLYGTMDRSLGHYRRYDKSTMASTLAQTGFVPVKQEYVNLLGALGWFLNGRVLGKQLPPPGQLRAFNLVVPIARVFESIFPPPLGISLVTVARVTE